MSFQAYLDTIKLKTGKTPEDFKKLAEEKGLLKEGVKAGEIIAWLKKDFDLGHGHSMALYGTFKASKEAKTLVEDSITKHFSGAKSNWRSHFDELMKKINAFGNDVSIAPTSSYLSVLRGERKMAVIQITGARMDIGIKLKDEKATARFETAGAWNAMMTHRVKISDPKQLDKELLTWLYNAYEQNAPKQ